MVDAVIALTVFYKGFDNIDGFKKYLGMQSPDLLKLVFVFGLVHGFGLSTRLQQLPLGDVGLLMRIISFNVGVELGQITALTAMLLLLAGWRQTESFSRFSTASNSGLMAAGVLLFFMQMHGYTHDVFADDLAFSKDAHIHAHKDMSAPRAPVETGLSELHSHDGGPMHRDVIPAADAPPPAEVEPSEWHSHDGGPAHKDPKQVPGKKKSKATRPHGGAQHSH